MRSSSAASRTSMAAISARVPARCHSSTLANCSGLGLLMAWKLLSSRQGENPYPHDQALFLDRHSQFEFSYSIFFRYSLAAQKLDGGGAFGLISSFVIRISHFPYLHVLSSTRPRSVLSFRTPIVITANVNTSV